MYTLKDNIKRFLAEYTTSRAHKSSNILYLTSNCNFNCDYCFEKPKRDALSIPLSLTYDDIDMFLDDVEWREDTMSSSVVFFRRRAYSWIRKNRIRGTFYA